MKLTLRLPDELYEILKALADKEHRSLNAQVVWMLEEGFRLIDGVVYDIRPPDTHQADTTPPDQRTATADGPGRPDFPPDKGKATVAPTSAVVTELTGEALKKSLASLCTCGPGERAKGKHNKKCPARER